MSNGLLTATSPSSENLLEYDKSYEEWLSILRGRNSALDVMPDEVVWKYGQNMHPKEASKVQSPEDYFFEEEKATRWLDDEGFIGRWLPESVQMIAKKAFNDSLGGILDMVESGETPYALIDKKTGKPYDYNFIQDSAAFVGSFVASPIDILTLGGGTIVGKGIGKGILRGTRRFAGNKLENALIKSGVEKQVAKSQAAKRIAEKFSDKHLSHVLKKGWKESLETEAGKKFTIELIKPQPFLKIWSSQGAPLGFSLAAYHSVGAAAGAMMEKGRRGPDGKWIPGELGKEDIPGIIKEGMVGLTTGYTLAGLKTAVGINIVGKSKYSKRMLQLGEFAGEVGIFGSVPNLLRGQLPNFTDEGELVWTKDGMPVQFRDEEGNLKNYSVYEGMKHSLFAITSLKGWHGGFNGISRYVGKRVRERNPEIKKSKEERDILEKIETETDSPELKTEISKKKDELTKKIESLEKENIEGFDESSYENILKIDDAISKNKEPKKSWVDKAEVELENIKEHLHKKRSELEEGQELSQGEKDLAQAMNRVKEHIDYKKENGWIDDRDNLIDKGKSDVDKKADLEGEFEAYLDLVKEGKEPKWKTIDEVLEYYDGNIDAALAFFSKYHDRKTPVSTLDTESNKKLDKILTNQEKEKADPLGETASKEAEKGLPDESVDIINTLNISETDKGAIKSLLHKQKYESELYSKKDRKIIEQLTGATVAFATWLNGKGKNLKDATQALFDTYMEGKTLSAGQKTRYKRQFKVLGLDIDLTGVKLTEVKDKIILTTREYQKNIIKTTKKLEGEGDVNITPGVKIKKSLARVIMNLKSRWGHRDIIFKRKAGKGAVTIGDVEVNAKGEPYGIWITEKSTKKGVVKVFRFLEPELISDVKSLMEGKNKGDLLFAPDGKTPLSREGMEGFNRNFISYGKEGVTGHKIRHFLINAARHLDKINKGKTNFTEFADRFLLLHKPGSGSDKLSPSSKSYLLDKEAKNKAADDYATFQQFMKQLKKVEDIDLNKQFTKSERERIAEEISAVEGDKPIKPPEITEIVSGSGAAFDRLTKKTKKGIVEFNDRDPNYTLKDKLADASLVGAEVIAQGAKTLKDFTTAMVERFGNSVKKYAKQLYEASSNVLAQSPERLVPNVMKKMGIKPEDIKFDVPEIEADKIIRQIKKQKYDDIELDKKVINTKIENVAQKKGITDEQLNSEVFEALGFYDKGGKPSIKGIKTKSDLNAVYEYIKKNYPDWGEPGALELEKMIQDEQRIISAQDKDWQGLNGLENRSRLYPSAQFLKKYGGAPGKWIGKKMDAWIEDYWHLVGMGDMVRETVKRYGLNNKEIDMMALMDRKAFSTKLTVEQERFQHDMFNVPESPQYKAREKINKMYEDYMSVLMDRLKQTINPRDYERIGKWLDKRMVKDYFTRRVTEEASRYYEHDTEGRATIKKVIKKQIYNDIVIKDKDYLDAHNKIRSLQKQLKDKDVTDKDIVEKEIQSLRIKRENRQKELLKDEKISVQMNKYYNQFRHAPDKLIHPNLDFIRLDLPEFLPNGKRMYQMGWDATVGSYINNSSKFIASITHFPSLTSWGSKITTPLENKMMSIYAVKGKSFGSYTERQLKNLVIGEQSAENAYVHKILSGWTAFAANTGLSSLFSGIKNFQIGDVFNFAAYGTGSFVKGYKFGFTTEGLDAARKVGALQAGSKHLSEIGLTKASMKYLSGMQIAEHSNRARAYATGMFWLQDALRFKRGERTLWLRRMGSEKWVDQKLRDLFEMSDKDIDFFKEHGLDADLIPMDTPNYDKVIIRHEKMMQHLATRTHVATQGATSVRDLPGWMNQGLGKYTTLFYRMAFSTSNNSYGHTFKPLILGNPLPLFRLAAMGVGHGTLLWQLKHITMGAERNNEHMKGETPSKLWESVMAVESFSLFGSTINAIGTEEGRGVAQEFIPVIATNAARLWTLGSQLYDLSDSRYTKTSKIKAVGQSIEEYMKGQVVAYNHWSKVRDKIVTPELTRYRQASRIIRVFENEKRGSREGNYNWDSPLYKSLEREIFLAEDNPQGQQIAAELYWVARMEMREKIQEESDFKLTQREADKKAKQKIEASIRNRIGVIPYSMNTKDGRIKIGQLYNAIDDEGVYIIRKASTDAKKRLDNFWKQTNAINTDNRYTYW